MSHIAITHHNTVKTTYSWIFEAAKAMDHTWSNSMTQPKKLIVGIIRMLRKWLTPGQMLTTTQPNQPKVWFIRLLRQWKGRIAKLGISTTELWKPTPDLSSLEFHNTYTPNTSKYSLHCCKVPQDIPSLPVLFRVRIEYFPAPLNLSVRFLSSLGLLANFETLLLDFYHSR